MLDSLPLPDHFAGYVWSSEASQGSTTVLELCVALLRIRIHVMRLCLRCLPLFLLPACAASSGSAGSAKPATQTISGGGAGSMTISNSSTSDVSHLAYSADAVWRIMPSVFDSLGIPVTVLDPGTKTIGNNAFKTRQRLGKLPLSKYLDCGNTQIGPNADSYEVILSVTTSVMPDGDPAKVKVVTVVEAQSRPITFNQAYNRCSSKGGIESRVVDIIEARLRK